MSAFCTLLIVLVIIFVMYLICGSVVRYRRGFHTFPTMLPHYMLWCYLCNGLAAILTCGRWTPCDAPTGGDFDYGWEAYVAHSDASGFPVTQDGEAQEVKLFPDPEFDGPLLDVEETVLPEVVVAY